MSIILIILLVIIIIIVAAVILLYNGLVSSRNRVKNSWAQIEVQLNRRADLIPNLVETVKGYASHEEGVFAKVTEARAGLMNANTVSDMADANNQLTQSLKSLFAVAEAYPELKASENFQNLQHQPLIGVLVITSDLQNQTLLKRAGTHSGRLKLLQDSQYVQHLRL